MHFFSQHFDIQQCLCLGKLFITAMIFFLGGRWVGKKIYIRIGKMSDFVRKKKSHLCELKGILQEKSSSVAGNAVPLCRSLYDGQEEMDRLTQHPSSAALALLPSSCAETQAAGTRDKPIWKTAFCKEYWRALTASHCWTMQTQENEGFMNGNAPQAIALDLGASGLGDGSGTKAPACGCEQCIMQEMLPVWRSPS